MKKVKKMGSVVLAALFILSCTTNIESYILASGSFDHTIKLWDVSDLDKEPKTLTGHGDTVYSVAFGLEPEKPYFYLEDPDVQQEKIELFEELEMMEPKE